MQLTVDPINTFMIPAISKPAQGPKALPEPPAGMLLNHFVQSSYNIGITLRALLGNLVKSCPGQADTAATALNRQLVHRDQKMNQFALLGQP
jgi:hypothetical protein